MVSIGKLLNGRDEKPGRFVVPLLEGIAQTAIETDPEEAAEFRKKVGDMTVECGTSPDPERILVRIGEVVEALREHNRRAERSSQAYREELHDILSKMLETITFISSSKCTSVEQLSCIEKKLENASNVSELKLLRNQLFGCLTLVRNECARLRVESDSMVDTLQAAVIRASTQSMPYVASMPADPVTHLAGPEAAEHLIGKSLSAGKPVMIALFVLEEIPAQNGYLGRKAGDAIFVETTRYLSTELAQYGPLLRWNGPALILVMEATDDTVGKVQRKIREVAEKRQHRVIHVDEKAIAFKVRFSWYLQSVRFLSFGSEDFSLR